MTPRNIQKQQEASYKRDHLTNDIFCFILEIKKSPIPNREEKKNIKKKIRRNSALSKKEKKKFSFSLPSPILVIATTRGRGEP